MSGRPQEAHGPAEGYGIMTFGSLFAGIGGFDLGKDSETQSSPKS